jgi:hypothetical protein
MSHVGVSLTHGNVKSNRYDLENQITKHLRVSVKGRDYQNSEAMDTQFITSSALSNISIGSTVLRPQINEIPCIM